MPITTDTFWNIKRLNRWFALSAVALTAVVVWTVLQDWDRSWREPQRAARVWEAALTDLKPPSTTAKLSDEIRGAPLLQFLNPTERIRQIVLPDVLTDLSFKKVETTDRCTTCHVHIDRQDFTRERVLGFLEAQLPTGLPEFWHAWAVKLSPEAVRQNLHLIKFITDTVGPHVRVTVAGRPIDSFRYDPTANDPTMVDHQNAILAELLKAWRQFESSAVRSETRGILVEIAPTIPSSLATAAQDAALTYPPQLQQALQSSLPPETYRLLQEKYRFALVERVNAIRKTQGHAPLDASPVLLAHPKLDQYAHADSPHAMETVGCTSCHDGSGQETNFVLAAHTPRPIWVDHQTGEPVLPQQLTNATPLPTDTPTAYIDPLTHRRGHAVSQAAYWATKYERESGSSFAEVNHNWDRPMRPPQFIEASCARCHTSIHDIQPTAPVLHQGRQLFTQMGCANCHAMDSIPADLKKQVGPDLRHITAKLSPAFLRSWIWAPQAFRPTTPMPHFFMLDNNSSDEEQRRTQQEVRAITAYLLKTATPLPTDPLPQVQDERAEVEARIARGRALFLGLEGTRQAIPDKQAGIGCIACHTNLNETGQAWITTDLIRNGQFTRNLTAKQLQDEARQRYDVMSYNERQTYAMQHLADPASERMPRYADGTPKPLFQRHAPELSGLGTKLLAGGRSQSEARQWLYHWLIDPQHASSYTAMPRLRLSPQEAMDLAEYLLAQQRTTRKQDDSWQAKEIAPDPQKVRDLIALFLRNQYSEQMAYQMSANEQEMTRRAALALANKTITLQQATQLAQSLPLEEKQLIFLGQKLVNHYGCMACHAINGMEGAANPGINLSDWGQKSVDKLDFGLLDPRNTATPPDQAAPPPLDYTRTAWITQKLKNTRIFDRGKTPLDPVRKTENGKVVVEPGKPYDKLKMPTFHFTDQQVHALATFVTSNRDPLVSPRLLAKVNSEQNQRLARGRQILERYNCTGCHPIDNHEPPVRQYWLQGYFDTADLATHAPPSLRGEGSRIQPAWLYNYLLHVEREGAGPQGKIRPLPFIRMPSFPLTDAEATALSAFFHATSAKESQTLAHRLEPLLQRATSSSRTASADPSDPESLWPNDTWFQDPQFADLARFLKDWALANTSLKPIDFADSNPPESLARAYRTALYDARFIARLYNARYPFADIPRPTFSESRFQQGERFFHYMQCHTCHVIGSEQSAHVNKSPKGPNLALAHRRLQRDWVRRWIQDPQVVQPNAIMPPHFSGRAVPSLTNSDHALFNLHGLPYMPTAPTPEQIMQIQAAFGQTVEEQTSLILDYLYAAGLRGHTAIDPPPGSLPNLPPPPPHFQPAPIPGITAPLPTASPRN